MNWLIAALAPALTMCVTYWTRNPSWGILAYHGLCLAVIFQKRHHIRSLFLWNASVQWWALGSVIYFLACFVAPLSIWDLQIIHDKVLLLFFPEKITPQTFALFAFYTLLIHSLSEEIFWRGAVTQANSRLSVAILGNIFFFYLLHVGPMVWIAGIRGWFFAIPAGLSGGVLVFLLRRSQSLWPGLISHWVINAALLLMVGYFFIK